MGKNLVIVESPAKAKTIKKYLWKDFDVVASIGHIEDLPENKLGVDIENNFQPEYTIMKWKKKVITDLKKLVKNHEKVYLATDEDREWEAIAWHLIRTLKLDEATPRITFHEITKEAIQNAIKNPRTINMNLVNAQQWRRILDRLVWYKVSPILWEKIKRWLSAWRVQSVAVRLIVEKEQEIKDFKPESFFELASVLKVDDKNTLKVKLKDSLKTEKEVLEFLEKLWFDTKNIEQEEVDFKVSPYLTKKAKIIKLNQENDFQLVEIKKSKSTRKPPAPFITSTLQQEASSKLGRWVKQIMQVAQKLYENGYITYMRTDDVSLSSQAIKQAEKVISSMFGKEYSNPTQYKTKNKNAQEAHEAIRPTNLAKTASDLWLNWMEGKLYDLIWRRTLASQMAPAQIAITTYNFSVKQDDIWTAKWEVIVFDWFLKVYWQTKDNVLPDLKKWEKLKSIQTAAEQKYTKAPARYTESSLVKEMEKLGIGRPSTYASIISTIIQRGYVEKTEDKKLKPTDIAYLVVDFLKEKFQDMMDYKFTAKMEDKLDEIAIWKTDYVKMLSNFWKKFKKELDDAQKGEKVLEKVGRKCPKCWWELVYKFWKFGKFIACSNYPNCKYVEQTEDEKDYEQKLKEKFEWKPCPAWWTLVVKKSRNGYFLASSEYPKIKWTMAPDIYELNQQYGGEKCNKCWEWTMVVRKWKRWYFLACDKYPKCKNIKPLKK
jgi:DNA topoisomerase-1